jgi:hypothetical protein
MNSRNRNITIGVGLLVSSIGYFGIRSIQRNKLYKKILAKMGGGASGYDYSEFYNPTYWQTDFGVPVIYLDNKSATEKARIIYDSLGTFNDDETAMLGALRSIKDGVALSQVAHKYQGLINRDLRDDLEWYYDDDSEVKERHAILGKLPPFRATA